MKIRGGIVTCPRSCFLCLTANILSIITQLTTTTTEIYSFDIFPIIPIISRIDNSNMKFATPAIALYVTAGAADAFVQKSPARTKTSSLSSYLDDLRGAATAPKSKSSGIANYLDSVPSTSVLPGVTEESLIGAEAAYLTSLNKACDGAAEPTPDCTDAITDFMGALSSGDLPAASANEGAQAIGNYLDNLAGQAAARQGGVGIQSHLSTFAPSPQREAGMGMRSYMDGLTTISGTVPHSAAAVKVRICMNNN